MNSNSDITITPIKPMVYNDYNTLKTELIKLAKELVSKLDNPSPDTIIKICKKVMKYRSLCAICDRCKNFYRHKSLMCPSKFCYRCTGCRYICQLCGVNKEEDHRSGCCKQCKNLLKSNHICVRCRDAESGKYQYSDEYCRDCYHYLEDILHEEHLRNTLSWYDYESYMKHKNL